MYSLILMYIHVISLSFELMCYVSIFFSGIQDQIRRHIQSATLLFQGNQLTG